MQEIAPAILPSTGEASWLPFSDVLTRIVTVAPAGRGPASMDVPFGCLSILTGCLSALSGRAGGASLKAFCRVWKGSMKAELMPLATPEKACFVASAASARCRRRPLSNTCSTSSTSSHAHCKYANQAIWVVPRWHVGFRSRSP